MRVRSGADADRNRHLHDFVAARRLKGRWTSAPAYSLTVGPKTGVNFVLVEDSLADVMILSQQAPQGRNWANGGAGPHLNRLFPQIHALPCFVFNSHAFFNAQCRQSAVAKLMRYYGTHLIELFGFFAVEQFKLSHSCNPPWDGSGAATPSVDPLKLRTANQGLRFQLFGQKEKSSGDLSSGGDGSSWA